MPRAPAAVKAKFARSEKPAAKREPKPKHHPLVKLGYVDANGVAPSLYVLVERGAHRRPRIAKRMRGRVELRFKEGFARVRIDFGTEHVVVQDAHKDDDAGKPDLIIQGSLPDIVQLAAAPLAGGVPKLTDARGRAALASVAGRRVKIEGSPLLARRLLRLLEI